MKKGTGRLWFGVLLALGVSFQWLSTQSAAYQTEGGHTLTILAPSVYFVIVGMGRAQRIGLSRVWAVLCGIPGLGILVGLGFLIAPDKKLQSVPADLEENP